MKLLRPKNFRTSHKVRTRFHYYQMKIDNQLKSFLQLKGGENNKITEALTKNSREEAIELLKKQIGVGVNPGTETPLWVEEVQKYVVENDNPNIYKILPDASLWVESYAKDIRLFSDAYLKLQELANRGQKDLAKGRLSLLLLPYNFTGTGKELGPIEPFSCEMTKIENLLEFPFKMLNVDDFSGDKNPRFGSIAWFLLAPEFQQLSLSVQELLKRKILFPMQTAYSSKINSQNESNVKIPWSIDGNKVGLTKSQLEARKKAIESLIPQLGDDTSFLTWFQRYLLHMEKAILEHALFGSINEIQINNLPTIICKGGGKWARTPHGLRLIRQHGGEEQTPKQIIQKQIEIWKVPNNGKWELPNEYKTFNYQTLSKLIRPFQLKLNRNAVNQLVTVSQELTNIHKKLESTKTNGVSSTSASTTAPVSAPAPAPAPAPSPGKLYVKEII